MARRRLILTQKLALGDVVLLTALVRDIHKTFPGYFDIEVNTHFKEVFDNNPYCRHFKPGPSSLPQTTVKISYQAGIRAAERGQRIHMLAWYHYDFARQTGMDLLPLIPHGDLHLSPAEQVPLVDGRYWLIMAGGKLDCTTKIWLPERWQQTVNGLKELGVTCVQAGANFSDHRHPHLENCIDLVGKTNSARQFFNLVMHADGVICPITAAMHVAACYDKPCVVLGGGRESPHWEAYYQREPSLFGNRCAPVKTEHRFLHTIGLLDCCKKKGCWKHRTVPLGNHDKWDREDRRCQLPVILPHAATPKCLEMIAPSNVIEAAMSYYASGEIPPIGAPKQTFFIPPTPVPAPVTALRKVPVLPGLNTSLSHAGRPANIDHPIIGGRFSVFIICYGSHSGIAKACFESIQQTLNSDCRDVRVGLNAVCDETREYFRGLQKAGEVTKVYDWPENIKKYPAMRLMFRDPECPINTPYLIWFDDDCRVASPSLWPHLIDTVIANHPQGSRLYGNVMLHDLQQYAKNGHDPYAWFKSAPWWKGKHLRVCGTRQEAPNGLSCTFVAGWFWALCTETMRLGDIPDNRIKNNGDPALGEQVHQLGFKIKSIGNEDKKYVWTPPKEQGGRRGPTTPFPWSIVE